MSRADPANATTWKNISPVSRDPGTAISGSRLTGLRPFLESLGKLTGPKSYFDIKASKKVGCVLTSNEVHFVSLADNFTV